MAELIRDQDVFGADEVGGIFADIGKAVTGVAKSGGKASAGFVKSAGLLAQGKVKKAGKQAASAVTKVTSNKILQAGWPGSFVVSNIAVHAAKGGPKAAMAAAKKTAQNPLLRTEVKAASVLFPPIAPLTASAIAATEKVARTHEALKSGDPKKIAQASFAVASTMALAAGGNKDAARGLAALNKIGGGMNLAADLKKGIPAAKKAAAAVNAKGGANKSQMQLLTARQALKDLRSPDPKVRAAAQRTLAIIQKEAPGLLEGVQAAMKVPERVELGRFAVLRTGRILLDGKPISKALKSLTAARRK
jgi:hypothetical protein